MAGLTPGASWINLIAAALVILAILVLVWRYRRRQQRRALACEFTPVWALKAKKEWPDLTVSYQNQPVETLFIVQARLKNTGQQPIQRTHLLEPLIFTFGPQAEFLGPPEMLDRQPPDLTIRWDTGEADLDARPKIIALDFDQLKPGEELTAEFRATGEMICPQVSAKIEGLTGIEQVDFRELKLRQAVRESMISVVVLLLAFCWPLLMRLAEIRQTLEPLSAVAARWNGVYLLLLVLVGGLLLLALVRLGLGVVELGRYRSRGKER